MIVFLFAEIRNAHLLTAPLPYYYHVKHSQISGWNWNLFRKHKFNVPRPRLPFLIKAVAAAAAATTIVQPHNHQPGIMLDLSEKPVDEREKLRRSRISKANKGNTPWNKGRKHSPGNYNYSLFIYSLFKTLPFFPFSYSTRNFAQDQGKNTHRNAES